MTAMRPSSAPSVPRRLAAALLALPALWAGAAAGADYSPAVKKAVNSITGREIQTHVEVLASDAYEGREAGARGGVLAGNYVARFFREYGLKPCGNDGTFFQAFALGGGGGGAGAGKIEDANSLEVTGKGKEGSKGFEYGKDFKPYRFSGCSSASGEVVFAGYGISAPEFGYDDYAGLDVKGRIVAVLSHEPGETNPASPFDGANPTKHSDPREKALLAAKMGAAAVLIFPNPANHAADPLADGDLTEWPAPDAEQSRVGIPALRCLLCVAERMLSAENKDLGKLQKAADEKMKPFSHKAAKSAVFVRVSDRGDPLGQGRNVICMHEGSDPDLKSEAVVVGAHYDHIGFGRFASMGGKAGEIHNGANDNASGTAGVMAIARAFAEMSVSTRRSVVFVAFDGEEKGLLGSKHYVQSPVAPLDRTVAMLNMDMIGRGPPDKIKVGGGTLNQTLQSILSAISARFSMGLDLKGLDAYLANSDQAPFLEKGIPCIFLSSGLYPELHKPDDDPPLLNQAKMQSIARTMLIVTVEVADLRKKP